MPICCTSTSHCTAPAVATLDTASGCPTAAVLLEYATRWFCGYGSCREGLLGQPPNPICSSRRRQ